MGADPAWRRQPLLFDVDSGPRVPSLWCRSQLVTEGKSPEKWVAIQPAPETIQTQELRQVFVSYYSQILKNRSLYSMVFTKAHGLLHNATTTQNLSSLLF